MIQLQVLLYLLLKQAFAVDLDQSPPKPGLDELSVSIVNYLETVSFGPFECWFYRERWSKLPEDNSTIEHLLTLNSLSLVPKKVISSPFDVKHAAIEQSSLIFFEFRSNESVFSEESILWQWQPQTKLLIFATGQSCRDIPTGVHNQFKARLEVFYLFLDADLICRSLPLTREMLEFERSVPLAVLFEDRTRQLNRYPIHCVAFSLDLFHYANMNSVGVGPSIVWIVETAKLINATIEMVFNYCDQLNDECWKNAVIREDGFNDIIIDVIGVHSVKSIVLPRLDLSTYMIITPRGRLYGVDELFMAPFKLAVWIVLITFLTLLKIVEIKFSSKFRNDLILLPLCGLEKHNFLKSSRTERITLTALIIFFFIVLSVYEVKITTLMTNRPRHADINTIEDLKRNGIKVLLPPMKLSAYEEKLIDLQFEHIDPSTQMENSLDGIHSYLFEEQSAVLYKFMCQEEDKERCMAYTSLSEKVKLLMRGNYIFNPTLMEPFSWIHQLLIESGIHNFSRENITSFVVGGLLKYRTLSDNAQVANMLNIADLKPAWISLGIGYAVGFSVASFELAFHSKMAMIITGLFWGKFKQNV